MMLLDNYYRTLNGFIVSHPYVENISLFDGCLGVDREGMVEFWTQIWTENWTRRGQAQ